MASIFRFLFQHDPFNGTDYCPYELVFGKTNNLPKQFKSIENIEPIYNIDEHSHIRKVNID